MPYNRKSLANLKRTAGPGKPKGTFSITGIIRRELQKIPSDQKGDKLSYAELLVKRVLKLAIAEGDVAMIKQIWQMIDGQPPQSIAHSGEIGANVVMRVPEKSQVDEIFTTLWKARVFERRISDANKTEN